jgi:large subunit ribosomal protein L21
MYAIIRTGGRQFRAEVGQTIDVERLPHQIGDKFDITDVLLIGDETKTVIGQPRVEGASVTVTVKEQFRGDKVIVFKYRQRTNLRKMRGHRQYHTRIHVDAINV